MLRNFIGDRKEGFIFAARNGSSLRQSNFVRRFLHPALKKLGIEKQGFHGFRRFRVTYGNKHERAMTGRGWESQIPTRPKGVPSSPRKFSRGC